MQVAAVPLKDIVRAYGDLYVQIARRRPALAGLALTAQANPVARIDTRRNLDGQRLAALCPALAATGVARISNHLAGAPASRTCLLY